MAEPVLRVGVNHPYFHCFSECPSEEGSCHRCVFPKGFEVDGELRDTCNDECEGCPQCIEEKGSPAEIYKHYPFQDKPKTWEPFLDSFTKFPELAIELRAKIWRFTLRGRTVEILYQATRGFYALTTIPVALKVNKDSRDAVAFLYPLSFGSILHSAKIVFNFSLDTLYIGLGHIARDMHARISQFIVGMTEPELKQIRSIAVDEELLEKNFTNSTEGCSCVKLFKIAAPQMPALKEFLFVNNIGLGFREIGLPDGYRKAPLEIFEQHTFEMEHHMYMYGFELCDEFITPLWLPKADDKLKEGFETVPKVAFVWGWHQETLPLMLYPQRLTMADQWDLICSS